jgi:hypothetical protein
MHKLGAFFATVMATMWTVSVQVHADQQWTHGLQSYDQIAADPHELISLQLQTLWPNTRVGAVSVVGNFALANWRLDAKAGRALLQMDATSGNWQVLLCGGDALVDVTFLTEIDVAEAATLAKTHIAAEVGLSEAEKVALGAMLKPMRFEPQHSQRAHKVH